ncbi:MAG: replication initiation protein RepC, partial [Devosia sp.]|nr:replication initiation protein RepC [Devosia sp.]
RELPLGIVLDACPTLLWLVKGGGGIRNWRDFLTAADLARPVLGISPSAWEDARVALGEQQAAITIAAIYQKSDQIKSPGGYLRNLTERAKEGKFSTWPMIMALLRAKLDAAKATGAGVVEAESELGAAQRLDRTQKRLEVSDNLRKSIDKWDRET